MLLCFTSFFLLVFNFIVSTRLVKPGLGFEFPVVDLVAKRGEIWGGTGSFWDCGCIIGGIVEGVPRARIVEDVF